jgi:trehalose 6-phosphate phosphatase
MTPLESLHAPGSWALFLDFDGTLVDLAARPEAVIVDPALPDLLRRLREVCGGALAIVTGRSVDVIDAFLPGLDLDVCGLHGMERRVGGRTSHLDVADLAALRAAVPVLQNRVGRIPGVLIEDKGESLALHWRLNPDAAPEVIAAGEAAVAEIGPGFRLQNGKALVEIVPAVSGKGHAIEALLSSEPYRGRHAFFAGDDVTDEAGFAAVAALGGLTIKVGEGNTIASHRVESPTALRRWLAGFAAGEASSRGLDSTETIGPVPMVNGA